MKPISAAVWIFGASLLAGFAACSDNPMGPPPPPPPPAMPVVSNPILVQSVAAGGTAMALSSLAPGSVGGDSVVFVSLPPGSAPRGRKATVRNTTVGLSVTTPVIEGGFDPVPLGARVGDSIQVVVRDSAGGVVLAAQLAVGRSRPPVVVRTEPPHKKVDVRLNSVMTVVFSEPVAASTLTDHAVRLQQGATPVSGALRFLDAGHTVVAFQPDANLNPNTAYQLVVTQDARDLNGLPLQGAVTVDFTTGSATTGPAASVVVVPDTASVWVGQALPVTAWVRDRDGNQLNSPVTWASSDNTTAIVDAAGLVTALDLGQATITAISDGVSGRAVIRVQTTSPTVAAVTVSPESATVLRGGSVQLTAATYDRIGGLLTGRTVTWTTSDSRIGTVSNAGLVTGVAAGSATMTATSEGHGGTAKVVVLGADVSAVTMAFVRAHDIYVTNADGSAVVNLTNYSPAWVADQFEWSPDGAKIVFQSFYSSADGIYTINRDGSARTRLNPDGSRPHWSPDGTKILFLSSNNHVTVMRADGTGAVELPNYAAGCLGWSPDGREIVYSDGYRIYAMNADGTQLATLTSSSGLTCPVWSPDGSKLLFSANRSIRVMNEDGTGQTTLATGDAPVWSPDGAKIAFQFDPGGGPSIIYTMNADGTNQVALTAGDGEPDWLPVWSPDGSRIAFLGYRNGFSSIFVMNADGSAATQLTHPPFADDYAPQWWSQRTPAPTRPVASVVVAPTAATMIPGQTEQLSATPKDAAGIGLRGRVVTWTSSEAAVATVTATGLVTARAPGAANIRATSEGVSASADITVGYLHFTAVSASGSGACALTTAGVWYCWGYNQEGELGIGAEYGPEQCNGVSPCSSIPRPMAGGLTFTSFRAGGCGLIADGTAYCWGGNNFGELGVGSSDNARHGQPEPVSGGLRFATVSPGACGLSIDGAAYCWGSGEVGQLGTGSGGGPEGCSSGYSCSTRPVAVTGGLTFTQVTKSGHGCGLTADSAAYCWGDNFYNDLGAGTNLETCNATISGPIPCSTHPVAVLGGLKFTTLNEGGTCALVAGGAAYCWGSNSVGQLGVATTTETCPYSTPCSSSPVAVEGGHSFVAISGTCGLAADGTAYCWGLNGSGSTPQAVSGGLRFSAISFGGGHVCGITQDSVVYCWGGNSYGQLGNGTTTYSPIPVKVAGQP